ncbi:Zinc finger CCCH domain-containing protein 55 [Linum perenne]
MDPCETTNLLLSKIKSIDPDNASKILGFILIHDLTERELASLAVGHETHLLSFISKARTHLGLSSNTLSATSSTTSPSSPLNPISRPFLGNCAGNPFSSNSRFNNGPFVDFSRNPSPHSCPANNSSSSSNCSISLSPKSSPFLSYDSIRAAGSVKSPVFSKSSCNADSSTNSGSDALEDYPFDEYLSFLDDSSSRNDEFDDAAGGDAQLLHRRRFSESDACPNNEDEPFGIGARPSGLNNRVMVGSPREMESLYLQHHEGMMRLKAAHQQQQQRLVYNKYMNFLLQQQQNDQQRNREDFHKFGRFCPERNDFFAMAMAEKANSASRQIYLTFPADSTFKDEDVSNYFSTFGPVEDVRIPYQQKRMFGFVTFLHPDTVKLILARGNPHFICDSRVLVKPYKEKGKASNDSRRQHHLHHQLLERGSLSSCSSPSGIDGRELFDLPMGPRMGYNSHEMMLRRKLDEHAELQQAIELQGRRLVNLQLPDLRGDYVHHQRSMSVGAPFSMPSPLSQRTSQSQEVLEEIVEGSDAALFATDGTSKQNTQSEVNTNLNLVCNKEEASNMNNCHGSNGEHEFHYNLADSRSKSPENQDCDCSPSDSSLGNTSGVSNTP